LENFSSQRKQTAAQENLFPQPDAVVRLDELTESAIFLGFSHLQSRVARQARFWFAGFKVSGRAQANECRQGFAFFVRIRARASAVAHMTKLARNFHGKRS
jgi:hypothetical protein